ncbi:hypothetical protein GDO81_028590, partial [Engystomops pustulosus]
VNQVHFIPVDLGSPIVHCAVADPYVVILSAEGQVSMFQLKSDTYGGRTHRLAPQKPNLHYQSKVLTLCVYRDVSGMFTTETRSSQAREESSGLSVSEPESVIPEMSHSVDDEDELLYGDSGFLSSPSKDEMRRSNTTSAEKESMQNKIDPTHWCVLVRDNGIMEVREDPGSTDPQRSAQRGSCTHHTEEGP